MTVVCDFRDMLLSTYGFITTPHIKILLEIKILHYYSNKVYFILFLLVIVWFRACNEQKNYHIKNIYPDWKYLYIPLIFVPWNFAHPLKRNPMSHPLTEHTKWRVVWNELSTIPWQYKAIVTHGFFIKTENNEIKVEINQMCENEKK